jgi:chromosome segregation ATPase
VEVLVGQYGPFLTATIIGLSIALFTWYAARKSGLAPVQAELIDTLQDNAMALNNKVKMLEQEVHSERETRQALERKVDRLEGIVIDLADENADLRRKLGMPRRRDSRLDALGDQD